jgi:hypothetical protein
MTDSKLLHFLKEFPAWLVLVVILGVLLWVWFISERAFLEHLIDTAMGGLLTLLIGRKMTQSANTNSGDIVVTPDAPADLSNLSDAGINSAVENLGNNENLDKDAN